MRLLIHHRRASSRSSSERVETSVAVLWGPDPAHHRYVRRIFALAVLKYSAALRVLPVVCEEGQALMGGPSPLSHLVKVEMARHRNEDRPEAS